MKCQIHDEPMRLIQGKYYCFACLSKTEAEKPIRYENLSALHKIPKNLQNSRLYKVLSPESNMAKSLQKLFNEEALKTLEFSILWIKHTNYLTLHKIASAVANERLIRHLSAEYWDLDSKLLVERASFSHQESEQVHFDLKLIANQPFHSVVLNEMQVIDKIAISRFCSYLNAYFKSATLNGNFVAFFSRFSFDEYLEMNPLAKNLLTPYKEHVKMLAISENAIIDETLHD